MKRICDFRTSMRRARVLIGAAFVLLSLSGCMMLTSSNPHDGDSAIERARKQLDAAASQDDSRAMMNFSTRTVSKLPAPKLEVNAAVRAELDGLLKNSQGFLVDSLKRRDELYPTLRQIFEDEGVPVEIMNVALIESGYRPEARSGAGAVGMWQFMKGTAKIYGLAVNFFEDQRKDPILSSIAAARYLRDLFHQYNDWYLALAAYNAGGGTIDRAILRTGQNDFWKISRSGRIHKETQQFVPRFIAATIIINNLNQNRPSDKVALNSGASVSDVESERGKKKIAYWPGARHSSAG